MQRYDAITELEWRSGIPLYVLGRGVIASSHSQYVIWLKPIVEQVQVVVLFVLNLMKTTYALRNLQLEDLECWKSREF